MQSRNILMVSLAIAALFEVTGCSQSKQSDSVASPDQNSAVNTNVSVDQNGRPNENGQVVVQPLPANGQLPNDVSGATANGSADDRQVNVSAPLTDVNVNRDTGSVHVNVPFVHINKEGRGQGTHIDIGGGGHSDSY